MKLTTGNAIKAFMVPLVALLLVLPLAMQATQVAANPVTNPVLQATAATFVGNTGPVTATVATGATTAVAATTQNRGNDFPWWLLLLPLAALLLIPLFMRRQQTQVVTRTTDTTPPPTTTSTSTTTRTTVAPKRNDQGTDDHTHV